MAASDVEVALYDNCEKAANVIVYDDEQNPGPLGKPIQMQIDISHPFAGWDRTDPAGGRTMEYIDLPCI